MQSINPHTGNASALLRRKTMRMSIANLMRIGREGYCSGSRRAIEEDRPRTRR
jgi:hypothetical protein